VLLPFFVFSSFRVSRDILCPRPDRVKQNEWGARGAGGRYGGEWGGIVPDPMTTWRWELFFFVFFLLQKFGFGFHLFIFSFIYHPGFRIPRARRVCFCLFCFSSSSGKGTIDGRDVIGSTTNTHKIKYITCVSVCL
jgi:hypothetical protein